MRIVIGIVIKATAIKAIKAIKILVKKPGEKRTEIIGRNVIETLKIRNEIGTGERRTEMIIIRKTEGGKKKGQEEGEIKVEIVIKRTKEKVRIRLEKNRIHLNVKRRKSSSSSNSSSSDSD